MAQRTWLHIEYTTWRHNRLLGIKLDDESLLDRHGHLFPVRQGLEGGLEIVLIEFQPARDPAADHRLEVFIDEGVCSALFFQGDYVTSRNEIRRDIDLLAVDENMVVPHQLPGLISRGSKANAKYCVVETPLEKNEEILAGNSALLLRFLKEEAELPFKHAIHALDLLLFTQLHGIVGLFLEFRLTVLPGTEGPSFEGTFIGIAAVSLQVQLKIFSPATTTGSSNISSQFRSPFSW